MDIAFMNYYSVEFRMGSKEVRYRLEIAHERARRLLSAGKIKQKDRYDIGRSVHNLR